MPPLLKVLRPRQWIKNAFVFAPLLFSLQFENAESLRLGAIAVIAFICASSAVYIFNDINDLVSDRAHPTKKYRPIAAGDISVGFASWLMVMLMALGLSLTMLLPDKCSLILSLYIGINFVYSRGLKNIAVLDVLIVAVGFVLRVLMGGYAVSVMVSPWLIMATFMLALFIAFGKRRHELMLMGKKTRSSLGDYNEALLDRYIGVTCAASLIAYALYAVETAQRTGKTELVYTIFFVAFGLFHYLRHIYVDKKGGAPERIIYSDMLFLGNVIAWLIATLWILAG